VEGRIMPRVPLARPARSRLSCLGVLVFAVAACQPDVAPPPPPVANSATAAFDPLATPPVVPTPNDLAFIGGDGTHLNIPDLPTDSAAQRNFNAYLRTLTGFPSSSTATTTFTAPIDLASATIQTATSPGSIVVVDTTTGALVEAVTPSLSADGTELVLTPATRWTSGHRYAVLLFGDDDPVGLRAQAGGTVLASPTFFILRAPAPLLVRCGDPTNPACVCPPEAIADPNDTSCHSSVRGLSDAQARQAEPQRAQLDAALSLILPLAAPNHDRANLVLFWTFTITLQPMAVFDPTRGALPFPNDLLIDRTTGLVALPIAPNDPQAALKMALNTLDGFSTSAAEVLPIDAAPGAAVDGASLRPSSSALLLNLDPSPTAEQPTFVVVQGAGGLAIQPTTSLIPDQRRYAVVVTRAVSMGGAPLQPAPLTVLLLQDAPLFDGTRSTVSILSDAQAQQLEGLRLALQPLLAALAQKGLMRAQIAALWTFTTQSIERPLAALDAFPTQAMLATDVSATVYTDFSHLPPALLPFVADVRAVVLGSFTTRLVYDPSTRFVTFARMPSPTMPTVPQADIFTVTPAPGGTTATVRFWLTLPKVSPGGGAPVVIVQHGITFWRGDMFSFGEDFAKAGRAAIAFDMDFHGARTRCASAADCAPQPMSENPFACVLAAFSGDTTHDCKPVASGQGYIEPGNLFGGRAGGFQYVVDAAQLVRVLRATGGASLRQAIEDAGQNNALDPSQLSFLGTSLGGMNGTVFLATDPSVNGASVFNVAGGHIFQILADGAYHDAIDQLLAANRIARGSPEYVQLVQTADWALDPVDPWSVGRFIMRTPSFSYLTRMRNPAKKAIVQEAGMDTTIPHQYQAALSSEVWFPVGVDAAGHAQARRNDGTLVSTFFADADHLTLLTARPSASMRVQALTWMLTGGAQLPAPTP
jgi:dienelactone hydrolase